MNEEPRHRHNPLSSKMFASPIDQLELWLEQALQYGIADPAVMVLSTVGADGRPDQRSVLLKHCDARGLVFFTADESKKARDIFGNPYVSALFPWHSMDRQVRICGSAEKIPAAETTQHLITRPDAAADPCCPSTHTPEAQAGASSRAFLMQQFETMKARFYDAGRSPARWSGFRIAPLRFEFWQGGGTDKRQRFEYTLVDGGQWRLVELVN